MNFNGFAQQLFQTSKHSHAHFGSHERQQLQQNNDNSNNNFLSLFRFFSGRDYFILLCWLYSFASFPPANMINIIFYENFTTFVAVVI